MPRAEVDTRSGSGRKKERRERFHAGDLTLEQAAIFAELEGRIDHYAPVRTKGNAEARATRVLTSADTADLKRRAWSVLVPRLTRSSPVAG